MTAEEVFAIWAPSSSEWSPWVAPALFAQTDWRAQITTEVVKPQELEWFQDLGGNAAVVVDLPGADSVEVGFALAARGFRPVPLYNASPGPKDFIGLEVGRSSPASAVIDMGPIVGAISRLTPSLQRLEFPQEAPPAFLLDSSRLSGMREIDAGMFDNRWMVFPQDFPSASFLKSHGIQRAVLFQKDELEPQDDLAHVLLRWQEVGIAILSKQLADNAPPSEIRVQRPSRYKAAWYRALAVLGLRRSSAGGFGSYIPEPTGAG